MPPRATAPVRVLSPHATDSPLILLLTAQGHFPEPSQDPVIQIASMITVQGDKGPRVRNVMTLGTCAPIVGSEVMSFTTEAEMLKWVWH
jgi:hypothetical protein